MPKKQKPAVGENGCQENETYTWPRLQQTATPDNDIVLAEPYPNAPIDLQEIDDDQPFTL